MGSSNKLCRLVFSLFQLLTTLLSLTLVVGAIILYATEPLSLLIPQDGLVTVMAGGSLTALLAFISFLVIGVRKRTDGVHGARLRWIVMDALMMAGLGAAFVLAALLAIKQAENVSAGSKNKFSNFWESASPALLTLIQREGQCCGFNGYSDRVLEPCKRYSEAVGCWTVLRDEYAYYLHLLIPALIILAAICSASAFLALILLVLRLRASRKDQALNGTESGNDKDETFRIKRSEPFDAWHKAVFV